MTSQNADGRPHGLDIIEALTGPDGWEAGTTGNGIRIVRARLEQAHHDRTGVAHA